MMTVIYIVLTVILIISLVALIKKPSSIYRDKPEERNPMEGKKVRFVTDESELENADGVRGHLEAVGETNHKAGIYGSGYLFVLLRISSSVTHIPNPISLDCDR